MRKPDPNTTTFMTAVEAAKRYDLSNDHISSLCRKGKIEGTIVGRVCLINEESLKAYLVRAQEEKDARKNALSSQFRNEYRVRSTPAARREPFVRMLKRRLVSKQLRAGAVGFAAVALFFGAATALALPFTAAMPPARAVAPIMLPNLPDTDFTTLPEQIAAALTNVPQLPAAASASMEGSLIEPVVAPNALQRNVTSPGSTYAFDITAGIVEANNLISAVNARMFGVYATVGTSALSAAACTFTTLGVAAESGAAGVAQNSAAAINAVGGDLSAAVNEAALTDYTIDTTRQSLVRANAQSAPASGAGNSGSSGSTGLAATSTRTVQVEPVQ